MTSHQVASYGGRYWPTVGVCGPGTVRAGRIHGCHTYGRRAAWRLPLWFGLDW